MTLICDGVYKTIEEMQIEERYRGIPPIPESFIISYKVLLVPEMKAGPL